ncbi:MAG TPA: ABC transporter ATP-binding protein [Candidatus Methylacidiphilales bacterium]|nr:ABC transporter ATP-binding protein [Candidatus Methylacidiphilales bacterium]
MSEFAIKAEGLGKKYYLGHYHDNRGLRHILQDALAAPRHWLRKKTEKSPDIEEFWALRDVSFEVKKGEALGIIGRNGAGKSTLLKILSRITEPTTGEVTVNGRVASLLEVGTGFHYELTGRENIYLNGTILGMSRREIRSKFDEIISFAEVEKFLDTPVKHYSSGMFVRLAFAVAAHLEPEILIIDEVLAVGDAQFQKKCLGKMEDVSKREGRTVLFVSHNMAAISSLTDRVLLLRKGGLAYTGATQEGINLYMANKEDQHLIYTAEPSNHPRITRIEITCSEPGQVHDSGKPWKAKFAIHFPYHVPQACFSFQIINQYQNPVLQLAAYDAGIYVCRGVGTVTVECAIPSLSLNVGTYYLKASVLEPPGGLVFHVADNACVFDVVIFNKMSPFGWRPELCAYMEECEWSVG